MEILLLVGGICLAVWLLETLLFFVSYRWSKSS